VYLAHFDTDVGVVSEWVGVGAVMPCLAMRANACLWRTVLGSGRPGEQPHGAIGLKAKLSIHVPGHG
jgi:hypothetical protein